MDSTSSERYLPEGSRSVKVVVLGPFGVGKTTFVRAVSEIRPLHTEERMTQAGELVDDLSGLAGKDTTTVAMDFGRVTLADDVVLYVFGAPGQARFARMVRSLLEGALGGIVLVDTRRLRASFDAIDLLEEAGLPYTVAVNGFDGTSDTYSDAELRDALTIADDRPLVRLDARFRHSAKQGLVVLVTDILHPRTRTESSR
ncbi:ATP/GTP-binding protein [Streptomyces sp. NPDC051976]|uniref:GTP-binding protein n=1 Tax=Streptomyces sp. NPDC051976 TaxID=3154947 RepID=UPI00343C98C9